MFGIEYDAIILMHIHSEKFSNQLLSSMSFFDLLLPVTPLIFSNFSHELIHFP